MKLSKLILLLQEILHKHGDKKVSVMQEVPFTNAITQFESDVTDVAHTQNDVVIIGQELLK